MDTRYISEFITLAESGNYSKACAKLYISQSSLSKHVMAIENELGVSLLIRTNQGFRLSPEGEVFLRYAQEQVANEIKFKEELYRLAGDNYRRITVAVPPELSVYNITEILAAYRNNTCDYTINLFEADPSDHVRLLREKICDLIITNIPEKPDDDLVCHCCIDDYICAVTASDHPFRSDKYVDISELKDKDLLLDKKGTMMYRDCVKLCETAGFAPKIAYQSHVPSTVIDMASKGMGVALLSRNSYNKFNCGGTIALEITPRLTAKICLCSLKEWIPSPAANHFINCAREVWKKIKASEQASDEGSTP